VTRNRVGATTLTATGTPVGVINPRIGPGSVVVVGGAMVVVTTLVDVVVAVVVDGSATVAEAQAGMISSDTHHIVGRRRRRNVSVMFGPLNGVRVVLVGAAVLASLAAFLAGYTMVGWLLMLGVGLHGLGWLYLYRQRPGPR
jgi:hypothetical protein